MNVSVSIIVAMDEKRGIGKDQDLLFRIPEDGKRVRELTSGRPLVMGRKTFESLGRLLPNRTHIVVTRDPESVKHLSYQPHFVVGSVGEGIEIGKRVENNRHSGERSDSRIPKERDSGQARMTGEGEIFIFGGGQIYAEALKQDLVDRLYLTIVKGDYGADTYFPEYPEFTKVVSETHHNADGYEYTFLNLEKEK